MGTSIFEEIAALLTDWTDLEPLEARGTVRLALKQAGLEARTVTADQMRVVLAQVLPGELRARGVEQPDLTCADLAKSLENPPSGESTDADSPEAIFRRLGSR